MSKEPDWIWNCMDRWLASLESIVKGKIESKPNSTVLQKQRNLMRSINYVQEITWLRSVIDAGAYPVVFCHNDLQEGNILLRQSSSGQERTPRESISILRWVQSTRTHQYTVYTNWSLISAIDPTLMRPWATAWMATAIWIRMTSELYIILYSFALTSILLCWPLTSIYLPIAKLVLKLYIIYTYRSMCSLADIKLP